MQIIQLNYIKEIMKLEIYNIAYRSIANWWVTY